jgi:WD40 repeat protein
MLPLPSSRQCHYTVAFSPEGRWLAAGGSARAVDVWDLYEPQKPARRLEELPEPIVRVQFIPEGRLFAYGPHNHRMYDAGTWSGGVLPTTPRTGSTLLPGGLDANHQSDYLLVRNPTGRPDRLYVSPRPHRVSYSADSKRAAVLTNGNLSVWDLVARAPIADRTSPVHGGWLSVAFDPRGQRLVTGGIDSTVAVWDAATNGPPLTTFQWGVGAVYTVAFDRDGLRAAAAGHYGAVVWDVDE